MNAELSGDARDLVRHRSWRDTTARRDLCVRESHYREAEDDALRRRDARSARAAVGCRELEERELLPVSQIEMPRHETRRRADFRGVGFAPDRGLTTLVNATKMPSLRGISRPGPFFHDNSAQTLEEVVEHFVDFFEFHFRRTCTEADSSGVCIEARLDGRLSEQDVQDIVAFMKLL